MMTEAESEQIEAWVTRLEQVAERMGYAAQSFDQAAEKMQNAARNHGEAAGTMLMSASKLRF